MNLRGAGVPAAVLAFRARKTAGEMPALQKSRTLKP
jgi:hypothetical protein